MSTRLGVLASEKEIPQSHIHSINHEATQFIRAQSNSLRSEIFN